MGGKFEINEITKKVNHHGKIITVGVKREKDQPRDAKSKQLIQVNLLVDKVSRYQGISLNPKSGNFRSKLQEQVDEGKMVEARKGFYENANNVNKNNRILKCLKFTGLVKY